MFWEELDVVEFVFPNSVMNFDIFTRLHLGALCTRARGPKQSRKFEWMKTYMEFCYG